jgi:hypothetical protein
MFAKKVMILFLVLFFLMPIIDITVSWLRSNFPHELAKSEGSSAMTRQESELLRAIITNEGFSTTIRRGFPTPTREVVLNRIIVELHQRKRIATIRLLLDILTTGNSKEAHAAGITALALEKGPEYAVIKSSVGINVFDKVMNADLPTYRERWIKQVKECLTIAENEIKLDGKTEK